MHTLRSLRALAHKHVYIKEYARTDLQFFSEGMQFFVCFYVQLVKWAHVWGAPYQLSCSIYGIL